MKNKVIIGVLMFCSSVVWGQLGVGAGYKSLHSDEWLTVINQYGNGNNHSNPSGFSFSIDYRLRTKKVRIELYPELAISSLKNEAAGATLENNIIGAHLNTNIYLFDLEGDCDCPTWSKSGNVFQKGFFLQVAPGVNNIEIKFNSVAEVDSKRDFFWDIGVGAGVDIGVAKFLTITPIVKYYFAPNAKWEYLEDLTANEVSTKSNVGQFYAGVRLGFHLKK
ncbi:MAG: hypothetical protein R2825_20980 [Saprospiraceae bacterium]